MAKYSDTSIQPDARGTFPWAAGYFSALRCSEHQAATTWSPIIQLNLVDLHEMAPHMVVRKDEEGRDGIRGGWRHGIRLTSVIHIISYLVLANFFHHDQRTFPTVGSNNSMDSRNPWAEANPEAMVLWRGRYAQASETTLVDRSCDPSF